MSTRLSSASPQIVTASWFTPLPPDVARIGISRGPPRGQRGYRRLPALAPGTWYRTASEAEYIRLYRAHLMTLDPEHVRGQIRSLATDAQCAALLCFEQPGPSGSWCHRSLAAQWLTDALSIAVPEWGFESLSAAEHPMLPLSLR